MEWISYIIIGFLLAGLFFASAIYALNWAVKNGQLRDLEKGAVSIFDEEEPLGVQTDYFPGAVEKARQRLASKKEAEKTLAADA